MYIFFFLNKGFRKQNVTHWRVPQLWLGEALLQGIGLGHSVAGACPEHQLEWQPLQGPGPPAYQHATQL